MKKIKKLVLRLAITSTVLIGIFLLSIKANAQIQIDQNILKKCYAGKYKCQSGKEALTVKTIWLKRFAIAQILDQNETKIHELVGPKILEDGASYRFYDQKGSDDFFDCIKLTLKIKYQDYKCKAE